jgi:hypothetical protein
LNAASALEAVSRGFRDAAESLKQFLEPFAALEKPKAEPKLVQQELDFGHRGRLGDVGYENEANPVRQAVGQIGGLANVGKVRAACPDRRRRGTVNVKLMNVNEKRQYWRWSKDRAAARAAGQTPPRWSEWIAKQAAS